MKAYRFWSKNIPMFWVEEVKPKVGDWGYTTDSTKAIKLSPYWVKRFSSDCNFCGVKAVFVA